MALIENPILNSAFREPSRHFKFDEEGITNEIVTGRRPSSHFVPIPRAKKKGKQLVLDTQWTQQRIEENSAINRIRQKVALWRQWGHGDVTPTTAALARWCESVGLRDQSLEETKAALAHYRRVLLAHRDAARWHPPFDTTCRSFAPHDLHAAANSVAKRYPSPYRSAG